MVTSQPLRSWFSCITKQSPSACRTLRVSLLFITGNSAQYLYQIKLNVFSLRRQKTVNMIHLSLFPMRNIPEITPCARHCFESVHCFCQYLILFLVCNTENEEARKNESPRETGGDRVKGKEEWKKP